jgi:uncharacterized membrane protein (GlpM family)
MQYIAKIILTALIVVAIAEMAKRQSWAAAILASLPLTSVLALTWLYVDTKNVNDVSDLSTGIFWMVIPSLVFFLILPVLLKKGMNYWVSLTVSAVVTFVCYSVFFKVLNKMGIQT